MYSSIVRGVVEWKVWRGGSNDDGNWWIEWGKGKGKGSGCCDDEREEKMCWMIF